MIPEPDLTGSENFIPTAQTFLLKLDAINAREHLNMWSVPPGFQAILAFPIDILHAIPCYIGDIGLHHEAENIYFRE